MNRFFGLLGLGLLTLGACSQNETPPQKDVPIPSNKVIVAPPVLTPDMKTAVEAQYSMAASFLSRMVKGNYSSNVAFSPYSFHTALSMLANGASEDVAMELKNLLEIDDFALLNSTASTLAHSVDALDAEVTLDIANALWSDISLNVRDDYKSMLTGFYNADYFAVDYLQSGTTDKINEWVEVKTGGKIRNFYDEPEVGPVTLVNALYFKGDWSVPFSPDKDKVRFRLPGKSEDVEAMYGAAMPARYSVSELGRTLTLPFGSGSYRMTVVLPPEEVFFPEDYVEYVSTLDGPKLARLATPGDAVKIDVKLPKFTVDVKTQFRSMMKDMGCGKLFETSRWPGISSDERPIHFDDVQQAVSFGINYKGGEGAAATGSVAVTSPGPGAPEPEKLRFVVDRPFIFIVTECGCNTPLFMGFIRNPSF
ncbi:MAG: serpin family protein [Muribaculaceae bacterium]|nr:serpin family protein [Muribaculaceae bacterium]